MCRKQGKSLCSHCVFCGMKDACEELLGCSSRVPCIFFGLYSFQKSPVSGPMVGQGLTHNFPSFSCQDEGSQAEWHPQSVFRQSP